MYDRETFFAVIPARKDSKGISNKNMQLIGDKPMIQFTIEAALAATKLKSVILSSDDENIIELAQKNGVDAPFKRPKNLSQDNSKISDVVLHALDWYETTYQTLPENIMLLQPTSPFRTSEDIDQAIDRFSNSSKKTLVSATELSQHPGDCLVRNDDGKYYRLKINSNYENDSGRQAYPETLFIDGGIYISETLEFLNSLQLIGDNPEIMITPQSHAIDIDTPFDLKIARAMYDSGEF
jgi:CMP-N,N'-diacetyllegionaminic acid synthase